jgi:hypothetical protein
MLKSRFLDICGNLFPTFIKVGILSVDNLVERGISILFTFADISQIDAKANHHSQTVDF